MSLVLEALRRVEKSSARPGSVGVAVTSYRPTPRRRGSLLPLFLGLGAGAILVFLWRPETESPSPPLAGVISEPGRRRPPAVPGPSAPTAVLSSRPLTVPSTGPAVTLPLPPSRPGPSSAAPARTSPEAPPAVVRPPLILQAISERDSHPVAVINDQLVREGDLFEGARILRIGSESVEVLLESGKEAVVRFAPPPSAEPPTTPEKR